MNELLGIIVAVVASWVLWRLWRRSRRTAAMRSLGRSLRQTRDVRFRVLAAPNALPLARASVTHDTGDLVMTADRFLLLSDRGSWLSLGAGARPLEFARCPVHGLLLLEGSTALPEGRASFRIELSLPDAADWASLLQVFVQAPPGAPTYAVRPPW